MLAFRDQENLVHAHQTVAASKPLNQGVKQLQPKTPGARAPKTPFKVPLNDENDPLAFGKKTVKGTGKGTVKQSQNTKISVKDAFVTPAGMHSIQRLLWSLILFSALPLTDIFRYSTPGPSGHENNQCQSQRFKDSCASGRYLEAREDWQKTIHPEGQEVHPARRTEQA